MWPALLQMKQLYGSKRRKRIKAHRKRMQSIKQNLRNQKLDELSMSLSTLDNDTLVGIVELLSLSDAYHLSKTNPYFGNIINSSGLNNKVLNVMKNYNIPPDLAISYLNHLKSLLDVVDIATLLSMTLKDFVPEINALQRLRKFVEVAVDVHIRFCMNSYADKLDEDFRFETELLIPWIVRKFVEQGYSNDYLAQLFDSSIKDDDDEDKNLVSLIYDFGDNSVSDTIINLSYSYDAHQVA